MQLRPEYNIAFDNVYSMSGMPEQNMGYVNANSDHHNDADGNYQGYDDKSNSLKRMPEDDHDTSNKRAKYVQNNDFTAGFQQGSSQFSSGMEGNLFNNELQRAAFGQQQMEFNSMSGGGAGRTGGLGLMERRMEQETNRQQQQSMMLANEMALMSQRGGANQAFGGADLGGNSQRNLFENNSEFFQNSNPMNEFGNLQGYSQLSSMSAQPFLSNVLDISLMNNRLAQQGFGGFNGGTLPPSMSGHGASSLNQSLNMNSSSQGNTSMGQRSQGNGGMGQLSAGFSAGGPTADPMSSLSPLEMLQLRLNGGAPSAGLQQQQQPIVPQHQTSSRVGASDMLFAQSTQRQQQLSQLETCQPVGLPPLEDSNTPHYSQRMYHPFSIDEDPNWLSEFQCFIRSEILELFRVSHQGIKVRNALKSLTANQVGIRCRFCAHLQHGTRANRASCFPSKIDKIYQSFTMMLREHFPSCTEIPEDKKQKFMHLQNLNAQGASNAKGFWEHAAKKKGLIDVSEENGRGGIHIFESTQAQATMIVPFGADSHFQEPQPPVTLIHKNDKGLVSNFLYALMDQVYRVHLAPSERKGNRKSLRPGMPGFGCRYCYDAGRMGLCRLFPARRRTIHTKIPDLFDHMKRCPLCPQQIKDNLMYLHSEDNGGIAGSEHDTATRGREREFFERIWARLGHQDDSE